MYAVSAMEQRATERARLKEEREEKKRKLEEEKLVSLNRTIWKPMKLLHLCSNNARHPVVDERGQRRCHSTDSFFNEVHFDATFRHKSIGAIRRNNGITTVQSAK